ncbi:MAG TPA: CRISPR-associated endonuclease Cas2 [Herpetosiphonaceae bacterium]|nr:CRISPR-associated endonuclease Cas2 [Herpetosiphonaceae bacterium]
MQTLLIYDIPDDRARTRVADACLDYGLLRIQYSAFLGELSRTHQEELMLQIKRRLGRKAGNVQLFPLDEQTWTRRRVIDQKQAARGKEASDAPTN